MGILLAVLLLADIVLARAMHLSGWSVFFDIWFGVLLLFICWFFCLLRPLPRLIDSVELSIWAVLLNNVLSALILIAGRSPRPLVDRELCMIDGKMHFSTAFFVHLAAHSLAAQIVSVLSYPAIYPLVLVALLALPFFGYTHAARRFVLGTTVSVMLTAALFALWPAAGPWVTENIAPTKEQIDITAYLIHLKSNAPLEVNLQDAAIISFPSFHVALAILSAVALGSFRRLRLWMGILTVLVCLSTITTGWHYGIDVLGGLAVAAVSIALAGLLKEAP
jgi:membrane-associated phospholipid phosphatase